MMPSPRCKRSKITESCTKGYTPRRHCAHHLLSESPVVLRGKVSVRDVHDVDHAAVTFRPTVAQLFLVVLGRSGYEHPQHEKRGIGVRRPLYVRLRSPRNDPVPEKEGRIWRGICPAN